MSHLIILTLVLNLIGGTAVFLYTLSAHRKFRRPFFKTLLAYILSFNGMVIVYFIYTYILTNVLGRDPMQIYYHPMLFSVLMVLVFSAEAGMTISLARLAWHLQGRQMTGTAKWLFALWLMFFGAANTYGMVVFFRETEWLLFFWIHAAWMFSLILIILGLLISSLLIARKAGGDMNSAKPFAWIFLAGYTAFAVSYLDFYFIRTGIQKYYDPVFLLLINLCPLIWLRFFFEKEHKVEETGDFEEKLARFCQEFAISKREREIIEQVVQGKSNKDIETILFISHNTVKNHLYSVFQKAGVGSRSELIHRISRFGES